MEILTGIGIFILIVMIIEGAYFAFRSITSRERKAVKERLKTLSSTGIEDESRDILRKNMLSEIPWFNRLLLSFGWTQRLNLLLEQSGSRYRLGVYVLLSVLLALVGLLASARLTSNYIIAVPLAVVLSMIPFLYLYLKKKRRMDRFQSQLPEALDLVARGLKAGHAFTGGLKLVGDEFDDPIGTEFNKTLDEINFGVGIPEAMKNLSNRVDCPDLKFFVVSVVIQRESGGNLAEILEKIAFLIRERFKLYGRIRVLSAQGKLSAAVLILLPFFVAFGFTILNPKYISILSKDPIGKVLIVGALILMIIGVFVMKRMIAIRV